MDPFASRRRLHLGTACVGRTQVGSTPKEARRKKPPIFTNRNCAYFDCDHTLLLPICLLKDKLVPAGLGIQVHDLASRISFRGLEVHRNFEALNKPGEGFPFLLSFLSREGAGATFLRRLEDKVLKFERGSIQKFVAHLRQFLPITAYQVRFW